MSFLPEAASNLTLLLVKSTVAFFFADAVIGWMGLREAVVVLVAVLAILAWDHRGDL
jgi:NhaP-type Na+/H+ and K+/H+ antiporter